MAGRDFDAELSENKAKYDRGEIDKDKYEYNAKRIRRQRRAALKSKEPTVPKPTDGSAPGVPPKAKKERPVRKPKVVEIPEEVAAMEQRIYDYFVSIGLEEKAFLTESVSWHCTLTTSLMEAYRAEPEKEPGQILLDKFKARWLRDPEFFVSYHQGGIKVYGLGPLLTLNKFGEN